MALVFTEAPDVTTQRKGRDPIPVDADTRAHWEMILKDQLFDKWWRVPVRDNQDGNQESAAIMANRLLSDLRKLRKEYENNTEKPQLYRVATKPLNWIPNDPKTGKEAPKPPKGTIMVTFKVYPAQGTEIETTE